MTSMNREEVNPCLKEQNISYQCLSDNNYDHAKCEYQFENYKVCKKFWAHVQSERRRKGITPLLPPVEDRAKSKEEYFANFRP